MTHTTKNVKLLKATKTIVPVIFESYSIAFDSDDWQFGKFETYDGHGNTETLETQFLNTESIEASFSEGTTEDGEYGEYYLLWTTDYNTKLVGFVDASKVEYIEKNEYHYDFIVEEKDSDRKIAIEDYTKIETGKIEIWNGDVLETETDTQNKELVGVVEITAKDGIGSHVLLYTTEKEPRLAGFVPLQYVSFL